MAKPGLFNKDEGNSDLLLRYKNLTINFLIFWFVHLFFLLFLTMWFKQRCGQVKRGLSSVSGRSATIRFLSMYEILFYKNIFQIAGNGTSQTLVQRTRCLLKQGHPRTERFRGTYCHRPLSMIVGIGMVEDIWPGLSARRWILPEGDMVFTNLHMTGNGALSFK